MADPNTNPHALILDAPAPAPTNGAGGMGVELRDISPPVEIPGEWAWLWWTLAILVLVGLLAALGIWVYRNRKEGLIVSPIPPHVRALRRLAEALAFLLDDSKAFCVEVSATLRVYLEERFRWRAPERTTEEFLHELQASQLLNAAQKASLADFLSRCDLVKFARYEPTQAELRQLHDSAVRLVEETIPALVPEVTPTATPPPLPPPLPPVSQVQPPAASA